VNLLEALQQLRSYAERLGRPLPLYGLAVRSSSLIYRLKVETLFEEPAKRRAPPRASSLAPPPILDRLSMPFRREPALVSVEELLAALEELLREEPSAPQAPRALEPLEQPQPQELLSASLARHLQELRLRILELSGVRGELLFSQLVAGLGAQEAARAFLCLLFLAQEGAVLLEQQEEEIRVVPVGA